MAKQRHTRILIYKRTHEGDPNESTGVFGSGKCMKRVRSWEFDAVIGVGGIRPWNKYKGIARKLTWIGIGAHKNKKGNDGYPLVTFDHFWYKGEKGPFLESLAPSLAKRMYSRNVRVIKEGALTSQQQSEVKKLLARARKAPPSGQHAALRIFNEARGKCQSTSCRIQGMAKTDIVNLGLTNGLRKPCG